MPSILDPVTPAPVSSVSTSELLPSLPLTSPQSSCPASGICNTAQSGKDAPRKLRVRRRGDERESQISKEIVKQINDKLNGSVSALTRLPPKSSLPRRFQEWGLRLNLPFGQDCGILYGKKSVQEVEALLNLLASGAISVLRIDEVRVLLVNS